MIKEGEFIGIKMRIKLPSVTLDFEFENLDTNAQQQVLKTIIVMLLSYWFDTSADEIEIFPEGVNLTIPEEIAQNFVMLANPRLVNHFTSTKFQQRRLADFNNNSINILLKALSLENSTEVKVPRILSLLHSFGHLDSCLEKTNSSGFASKNHFVFDLMNLQNIYDFSFVEIEIICMLAESRVSFLLENDFAINQDLSDDLKIISCRELLLFTLCLDVLCFLIPNQKTEQILSRCKLRCKELQNSISSPIEDLDFQYFISSIIRSVRSGGGFSESSLLKTRLKFETGSITSTVFRFYHSVVSLLDIDPTNLNYIESVVMPQADILLISYITLMTY